MKKTLGVVSIVALFLALTSITFALPRVLIVGGSGEYLTIQSAINACSDGDVVLIPAGIYTGEGNRDIDFNGLAITVSSMNPDDPDVVAHTIIDCQGSEANPRRGFYFHSGEGSDSVLQGVTITNGDSPRGGGIICLESNPTISNCIFSNNRSSGNGGGMYNDHSDPTVINCVFIENLSAGSGGGMHNKSSNPILTNCIFDKNDSSELGPGYYSYGGGVHNIESNPTITDCIFSNNIAGEYPGGGMCNEYSSPTVTNCTFTENSSVDGGGMFNKSNSRPTLTGCKFNNNTAADKGGGICNLDSRPTIINCIFSNNTAEYEGGGMYNGYHYIPIVINCIFSGNNAWYGGGMYNASTNPKVINCTFMNNTAQSYGGGMYNFWSEPAVTNCILWSNTPEQIYNHNDEFNPVVTYSNIAGSWEGEGNINITPEFVDAGNGNLHLSQDSQCIDAGDPDHQAIELEVAFIEYHYAYAPFMLGLTMEHINISSIAVTDITGVITYILGDDYEVITIGNRVSLRINLLGSSGIVEGQELIISYNYLVDISASSTDLDGNERVLNGRIDMGAYEFVSPPPIEAQARVYPRVLNAASRGRYVIARMQLPDGVLADDVAEDSLVLIIGDVTIESVRQRGISSRGQDYVFAFFDRSEVIAQAEGKPKLDIIIAGKLTTGQCIYGEDSIKIVKSQASQKKTLRRMPARNNRGGRR